jgi:hypothetical protein
MNTDNTASELVTRLNAASNKRERNKVLRDMARAFCVAIRNCDCQTRDILHEKLNNYQFDISPYAAR